MLGSLKAKQFLLDGELIIPVGDALSFEALQLRLHPAESRVRRLASETPAEFMAFDLLELGGKSLARPAARQAAQGAGEILRQEPGARHCTSRR